MTDKKSTSMPLEGCPRLVLIGGFLGAGKTTLIGLITRKLSSKGFTCGIITNDQAANLVDTALAKSGDAESVVEVSGGCFCCKLDELKNVFDQLKAELKPRTGTPIILAEPVGSCTDLMATVVLPLEATFGVTCEISPLTVVIDARRALASMGGARLPGVFSKDVGYIYRKQIEEAEILAINKSDLLTRSQMDDLKRRLASEYPAKKVCIISAREETGIDELIAEIFQASVRPTQLMNMDYQRYAIGEAELGWLNAVGWVRTGEQSGDEWLLARAKDIAKALTASGSEVAHFKMSLADSSGGFGTVNQVINGIEPEISRNLAVAVGRGTLVVNLRAEANPDNLRAIVTRFIEPWLESDLEVAAFRPSEPKPTMRITELQ